MKKVNGKECNTATEFDRFKDVLFTEKNYQTQNEKNSKQKASIRNI